MVYIYLGVLFFVVIVGLDGFVVNRLGRDGLNGVVYLCVFYVG